MEKSEKVLWDKCFESMSEDEYCSTTLGKLDDIFKEYLIGKATAYDRLMSGGKKTLKEWANIFGCPIAMDSDGWAYLYEKVPVVEYGDWCNPSGKTVFFGKVSPSYIDFSGDWTTSLTLPDGWEEKE